MRKPLTMTTSFLSLCLLGSLGCAIPVEIRPSSNSQHCPATDGSTISGITPILGVTETRDGEGKVISNAAEIQFTLKKDDVLVFASFYFVAENDSRLVTPLHFTNTTKNDLRIDVFRPASQLANYLQLVAAPDKLCFSFHRAGEWQGQAYLYLLDKDAISPEFERALKGKLFSFQRK